MERGPGCARGPTACALDSAAEMRAMMLRSRSSFTRLSGDWVASGGASCSMLVCQALALCLQYGKYARLFVSMH